MAVESDDAPHDAAAASTSEVEEGMGKLSVGATPQEDGGEHASNENGVNGSSTTGEQGGGSSEPANPAGGGGEVFDPLKNLKPEQMKALEEMREKANEYAVDDEERKWCNDMCLLRYLRARDYHVSKSEKMLKSTLDWKREAKPDKVQIEDVEPVGRTGCVYTNGFDKKGRPIVMMRPYKDIATSKEVTSERKFNHLMYWLEKAFRSMDDTKGVENLCLVVDYSHYGRKHMDMKTNMHVLHYMLNHLPERLGLALFLDPPLLFWVGWKVISPFLNEVTMAKVRFVYSKKGKDGKRDWPDLLEHIDEEALEEEFGGKNKKVYDYDAYVNNNHEL